MRLVIIANPVAGGGRAYRSIRDYVQNWHPPGWDVEIRETQRPEHAGTIAEELTSSPPDLVGICGGDGTLNEVASRLARPPFPIAILPAGTANVVAREFRIPLNPVRALDAALKGVVRLVDLGELNAGSRRFLFVAGIGFDAFVVSGVNPGLKKKIGMAAYAAAIVSCLRSYSFPEFQVTLDGRTFTATSCLACNAKKYGGGLLFCPGADMSDGLLDVLILEGRRRLALGSFLLQAWLGKAVTNTWVHRLQARTLHVEGRPGVRVQSDGELAGSLPVEISLIDKAFPLVVPVKP
jgi:diacylglycerol kinase (ATP)